MLQNPTQTYALSVAPPTGGWDDLLFYYRIPLGSLHTGVVLQKIPSRKLVLQKLMLQKPMPIYEHSVTGPGAEKPVLQKLVLQNPAQTYSFFCNSGEAPKTCATETCYHSVMQNWNWAAESAWKLVNRTFFLSLPVCVGVGL